MFRRHHQGRRSTNIVFVIFRLILSLVMFAVLLGGVYSAYKHFSGLDPLKLDPQAVLSELLAGKIPKQLLTVFSSTKATQGLSEQISQKVLGRQSAKEIPSSIELAKPNANLAFRFLLLADSHSNNDNLTKAINQAKANFADLKFIIGLGDYTDVGTIGELENAKAVFDSSSLRYFLIPGDHDLWDCRNRSLPPVSCFNQVFGPPFQSFTFDNFRFLILNNSDNYSGFGEEQLRWITAELEKFKEDTLKSTAEERVKGLLVFMHEPLYHPSSDHVMGRVEKSLKAQIGGLLFQLKDAGTAKVFAGDTHYFSEYNEPTTNIVMVTIGAVTSERNPQSPRFGVVSVFDDGSIKAEDIEIK